MPSPVKTWQHGEVTYAKALRIAHVRPAEVKARFGTWVVTEYGLECLSTPYPIARARLWENETYPWPAHMSEKTWVNMEDFMAAFNFAQEYHGHKRGK